MRDSILSLFILCLLVHRAMDFYGVFSKWKQLERQYCGDQLGPMPLRIRGVLDNFHKIAMGCGAAVILWTVGSISFIPREQLSLVVTGATLLFSLCVSALGFWADLEREHAAQTL